MLPGVKKPTVLWKIYGHWTKAIFLAPVVNGKVDQSKAEVVYDKPPYPAHQELQYGMTSFQIQLNNFPKWLEPLLPPTDCRRRPDQRHLELGNLEEAAKEKERLEIKQRQTRK